MRKASLMSAATLAFPSAEQTSLVSRRGGEKGDLRRGPIR